MKDPLEWATLTGLNRLSYQVFGGKGGTNYVSFLSFTVLGGYRQGLEHPGEFGDLVALCKGYQV